MSLGGKRPGGGMAEGWGGFLGLLDILSHFGHDRWFSRGPYRASVAAIFRWATVRAGKIGGLLWIGVGLYALQARPVCTALGCCEWYRSGGHGRTCVS